MVYYVDFPKDTISEKQRDDAVRKKRDYSFLDFIYLSRYNIYRACSLNGVNLETFLQEIGISNGSLTESSDGVVRPVKFSKTSV